MLVTSARSASLGEVLDRAGGRGGGSAPFDAVAQMIRDDRDRRA